MLTAVSKEPVSPVLTAYAQVQNQFLKLLRSRITTVIPMTFTTVVTYIQLTYTAVCIPDLYYSHGSYKDNSYGLWITSVAFLL